MMSIKEKRANYFMIGIVSAMDLSGSVYKSQRKRLILNSESRRRQLNQLADVTADTQALRKDWNLVGAGIQKAIEASAPK